MTGSSSGRHKRAFSETLKSARIGVPEAQYEVALMYANGVGVSANLESAVYWVKKAAEKGLASAQYLLATRYAGGIAVEQDDRSAIWWFMKAAEQGHAKAHYKIGKMLSASHVAAANASIRHAAELELAEAQFALGRAYAGGEGYQQNFEQAFAWYLKAAKQGFVAGQCALAHLYSTGQGVERNMDEALIWYRKAVQQDSPVAQVALELLDIESGGRKKSRGNQVRKGGAHERRQGSARWAKVEESGDAEAKYHLALMYDMGLGVPQDSVHAENLYLLAARLNEVNAQLALAKRLEHRDDESSFAWYERAARSGSSDAAFALGRLLSAGQGVVRDHLAGISWYCKAAEQGNTGALLTLGAVFSGSVEHLSVACVEQSAKLGIADAQFALAQYCVQKDPESAVYWWRLAALQGHALAQAAMGRACLKGDLIPTDFQEAHAWFLKAAMQGDANAQWNLGALYAGGGAGITPDLVKAFEWCYQAAQSEYVPALATLGVLYARMNNYEKAVQYWARAAEGGDAEAQFNLATSFVSGKGVAKDEARAFLLFMDAGLQGLGPAQSKLGLLYATGEGAVKDPIEAHKWFLLAQSSGDAAANENLMRSDARLSRAQVDEAKRRALVPLPGKLRDRL